MGGLLQPVDIYRTNSKEEAQKVFNKWVDKDYLVEYELQEMNKEQGIHVLIAFEVSHKKEIF